MLAPPVAVTVMLNVPAGTFDGRVATIWLLLADTNLSVVLLNTTVGATLVLAQIPSQPASPGFWVVDRPFVHYWPDRRCTNSQGALSASTRTANPVRFISSPSAALIAACLNPS